MLLREKQIDPKTGALFHLQLQKKEKSVSIYSKIEQRSSKNSLMAN